MFPFSAKCFVAIYIYKAPGVSMKHRPLVRLCEAVKTEIKVYISKCIFVPTQWGPLYAAMGGQQGMGGGQHRTTVPHKESILKQYFFSQKQQHMHLSWVSCLRLQQKGIHNKTCWSSLPSWSHWWHCSCCLCTATRAWWFHLSEIQGRQHPRRQGKVTTDSFPQLPMVFATSLVYKEIIPLCVNSSWPFY